MARQPCMQEFNFDCHGVALPAWAPAGASAWLQEIPAPVDYLCCRNSDELSQQQNALYCAYRITEQSFSLILSVNELPTDENTTCQLVQVLPGSTTLTAGCMSKPYTWCSPCLLHPKLLCSATASCPSSLQAVLIFSGLSAPPVAGARGWESPAANPLAGHAAAPQGQRKLRKTGRSAMHPRAAVQRVQTPTAAPPQCTHLDWPQKLYGDRPLAEHHAVGCAAEGQARLNGSPQVHLCV